MVTPSTRHPGDVLRPQQVRGANSAVVLQLLRRFDRMSRAEIARQSGLSEGTVSRIVSGLLQQSLVSEVGAENSTGGRPATRLQLSDYALAVGIEIQSWETRLAVATMRGQLLHCDTLRTPSQPKEAIALLAERAHALLSQYSSDRIQGVGITARGIINSRTGIIEMGSEPGWVHVPLQAALESALNLPVHVENDVRAAALAEYHYTNAGEHAPHCLLYLRVDEGVGLGLILNGRIYAGPSMSAGEFGQMVIADDGSPERHDRPGCLEKLAANAAICDRYAAVQGRRTALLSDSVGRVRKICQLALSGDEDAQCVLQESARYLGMGVANIAWGLNPETIVLNSTMNLVWPMLHSAIQDQFPAAGEWPTFRKLVIQQSALGDQGTLMGAATLAFNPLFEAAHMRVNRHSRQRPATAASAVL